MGPGLTTSAQLQGLRERLGAALPTRTLWMSATLGAGKLATVDLRERPLTRLDLTAEDRAKPALARRLAARKPLRASPTKVRNTVRHDLPADPRQPTVARRRRFTPALDTGDSLRIPTGANTRRP